MEYRVIGNENPIGSRRSFEDRVNLHLRFGWQPQGPMVSAAVKAQDWIKNAGVRRPEQSLFLFQSLIHPREGAVAHLSDLGKQLKALQSKDLDSLSHPNKRLMRDLATYLEEELEYHGDLFVDREINESLSEVHISRERLRRALKSLERKPLPLFAPAPAQLPLQDAA